MWAYSQAPQLLKLQVAERTALADMFAYVPGSSSDYPAYLPPGAQFNRMTGEGAGQT